MQTLTAEAKSFSIAACIEELRDRLCLIPLTEGQIQSIYGLESGAARQMAIIAADARDLSFPSSTLKRSAGIFVHITFTFAPCSMAECARRIADLLSGSAMPYVRVLCYSPTGARIYNTVSPAPTRTLVGTFMRGARRRR